MLLGRSHRGDSFRRLGPILSGLWHSPARPHPRFWKVTRFTIRVAWCLILIHVIEIAVWALVFWWQKCLPDAESSFYFAGVTYTTVGYGDLVQPKEWRLFGPLEGLTGILRCGLSTSVLLCGSEQKIRDMVRKQSNLIPGGEKVIPDGVDSLTPSCLWFREK